MFLFCFSPRNSKESDKAEAYDNGGDDYLVKPFSKAELMMKVKSLLRRYVVYRGKQDAERFGAAGDDTDPGYPRKPGPARSGAETGGRLISPVRSIRFLCICWITEAEPAARRKFTRVSGRRVAPSLFGGNDHGAYFKSERRSWSWIRIILSSSERSGERAIRSMKHKEKKRILRLRYKLFFTLVLGVLLAITLFLLGTVLGHRSDREVLYGSDFCRGTADVL